MSTVRNAEQTQSTFEATWLTLMRWSAWLVVVVGALVAAPPASLVPAVPGVVRFTLAIFVGLMIVPLNRWKRRRDGRKWSVVAVAGVVLALAMFFVYANLVATHTAMYAGERVVIGSEPTPLATEYVRANPTATPRELLDDAAGERELLWTRASIVRNEQLLAALYLLLSLLVAVSVLATVQVIACGRATVSAPPPAKS